MVKITEKVINPTKEGYNKIKVGENRMIERIKEFDDNFPDGVFAIPRPSNEPRVKVRALMEYCKQRGINPTDLTEREMERFLVR